MTMNKAEARRTIESLNAVGAPVECAVGRLAPEPPERCADCDLPNGCQEYCWGGVPSVAAAEAMGAKGGLAGDGERLAFEAWMRGRRGERQRQSARHANARAMGGLARPRSFGRPEDAQSLD